MDDLSIKEARLMLSSALMVSSGVLAIAISLHTVLINYLSPHVERFVPIAESILFIIIALGSVIAVLAFAFDALSKVKGHYHYGALFIKIIALALFWYQVETRIHWMSFLIIFVLMISAFMLEYAGYRAVRSLSEDTIALKVKSNARPLEQTVRPKYVEGMRYLRRIDVFMAAIVLYTLMFETHTWLFSVFVFLVTAYALFHYSVMMRRIGFYRRFIVFSSILCLIGLLSERIIAHVTVNEFLLLRMVLWFIVLSPLIVMNISIHITFKNHNLYQKVVTFHGTD